MIIRKLIRQGKFWAALPVLFLGWLLLLHPASAGAVVTGILPDPGNHSTGTNVYLEHTQPGFNVLLDAPESWAELVFDTADTNLPVSIFDGPWSRCDGNFADGGALVSAPCPGSSGDLVYEFFQGAAGPNGNVVIASPVILSVNGWDGSYGGIFPIATMNRNNWSSVFNGATFNFNPAIQVNNHYVLLMRARWLNGGPPAGRINAFKVQAVGGIASYWAQADPQSANQPAFSLGGYAVQDRLSGQNSQSDSTFEFAPPCSLTGSRTAYLKWQDADHVGAGGNPPDGGSFAGDVPPSFELREFDAATGVQTGGFGVNSAAEIGGNGAGSYRARAFTISQGHRYQWIWRNVNTFNGLQFWIPYDTQFAGPVCGHFNIEARVIGFYGGQVDGNPGSPTPVYVQPGVPFTINVSGTNLGTGFGSYFLLGPNPNPSFLNPVLPPTCSSSPCGYDFGANRFGMAVSNQAPQPNCCVQQMTFQFNINSTVPDGTTVCFEGHAIPGSNDPADPLRDDHGQFPSRSTNPTNQPACFLILNPRFPYLTTSQGDVHAGGNILGLSIGTCFDFNVGRVIGRQGNADGSKAQFLVSSRLDTRQFQSANGTPPPGYNNRLTLGNDPLIPGGAGYYGSICRPDLEKNIKKTYTLPGLSDPKVQNWSSGQALSVGAGKEVLAACSGNGCGTVQIGANPNITQRMTLFVDGDVRITGNIQLNNSPQARPALPSFGLIATGNISIDPGVTRLDGFYYAGKTSGIGGTIDTCTGANIGAFGGAGACQNQLIINGFLMGKDFKFKRTYGNSNTQPSSPCPPNCVGKPAEQANFLGLLYVSTPPGFSDFISNAATKPRYFGESNPRY